MAKGFLLAITMLLVGAQLTGCVVYDDRPYYHHYHYHGWYDR